MLLSHISHFMNCVVIEWNQWFLLISRGENKFKKSTFILVIKIYILTLQFSILNIKYESHIICSALCVLYISYNLSFKMFFQEMNASLKAIDCIFVVFKLFIRGCKYYQAK